MSRTFTKLFSSITESTIWVEPSDTRIVWVTMLAMSDRHGRVWGSIPGLANRAVVSVEAVESAIAKFMAPDKYSRTPDNEGRRIEPIDGGWRLLNHEKYREIRDEEQGRDRMRDRVRKHRARKSVTDVTLVTLCNARKPHADADTEAYSDPESDPESDAIKTTIPPRKRAGRQKANAEPAKGAATWDAYAVAYNNRYGVDPVRNAKANGIVSRLVDRLGDESPAVAGYYVGSNSALYVRSKHCLDLLLRDAEGLRTELATGRMVTTAAAAQVDRAQTSMDVVDRVAKRLGVA